MENPQLMGTQPSPFKGFWIRFLAAIIDIVIILVALIVVVLVFGIFFGSLFGGAAVSPVDFGKFRFQSARRSEERILYSIEMFISLEIRHYNLFQVFTPSSDVKL